MAVPPMPPVYVPAPPPIGMVPPHVYIRERVRWHLRHHIPRVVVVAPPQVVVEAPPPVYAPPPPVYVPAPPPQVYVPVPPPVPPPIVAPAPRVYIMPPAPPPVLVVNWIVSPYFVFAAGLDVGLLDMKFTNDTAYYFDGQLGAGIELRLGQHVGITFDGRFDGKKRINEPDLAVLNTRSINGKEFHPLSDEYGGQFRLGVAAYF